MIHSVPDEKRPAGRYRLFEDAEITCRKRWKSRTSLNYFGRKGEDCGWHGEAEFFGGVQKSGGLVWLDQHGNSRQLHFIEKRFPGERLTVGLVKISIL